MIQTQVLNDQTRAQQEERAIDYHKEYHFFVSKSSGKFVLLHFLLNETLQLNKARDSQT